MGTWGRGCCKRHLPAQGGTGTRADCCRVRMPQGGVACACMRVCACVCVCTCTAPPEAERPHHLQWAACVKSKKTEESQAWGEKSKRQNLMTLI